MLANILHLFCVAHAWDTVFWRAGFDDVDRALQELLADAPCEAQESLRELHTSLLVGRCSFDRRVKIRRELLETAALMILLYVSRAELDGYLADYYGDFLHWQNNLLRMIGRDPERENFVRPYCL